MSNYLPMPDFFKTEKIYLTNDLRGLDKGYPTSISYIQEERTDRIFVEFENGDIADLSDICENDPNIDMCDLMDRVKETAIKMVRDSEKTAMLSTPVDRHFDLEFGDNKKKVV